MSQLSEILHGDSSSGKNHKSLIARLGQLGQKYTDPLAWIFGRKYTDKLVDIADFSNKQFSSVMKPFDKVDKTINPLRRYNVVPAVNNVKDWVSNKPADATAIAAGAYFGGGALGDAFGGGSGGGAGAAPGSTSAGSGGGGSSGGLFNMDWQNPQTYTRFANMGGQQSNQKSAQAQQQEEERRKRQMIAEALRNQTGMRDDFLV